MELILKDDIKGLGYKDDVVSVKPGYGRNYLIPKGLAILATPSNKKILAENLRQASHKAEKMKTEAENIAVAIGELELVIGAKAGESGKIFGAVTAIQIADALKDKGFDIDRRKISFTSDIKMLGEYSATLDLHKEVKKDIKIKVVEE